MVKTELKPYFDISNKYEIGIDEVGRGPMFGRLYLAGVILPKDDSFSHNLMRDSKKIHSKKKMAELAQYIKDHAISWHIHYIEPDVIDTINIRQAVLTGMQECAKANIHNLKQKIGASESDFFLLVDGNDFKPLTYFNETTETIQEISHTTVEQGDNSYSSIAAASIIAKHARDEYILQLCEEYPELSSKYGLDTNMGYGTKIHMEGIKTYGITQWHRKSYGACKTAEVVELHRNI